MVAAARLLCNPFLTSDDAFFLDAGVAWWRAGRLALPLWGDGLGHASFLGSYPPVMPILSSLDARAFAFVGQAWAMKVTDVVLLAISAVVFWRSLAFVTGPWTRASVVVAVLIEPVAAFYYFSLRPEALLIPLVFALFLSVHDIVARSAHARSSGATAVIAGVGLAATHWQFAPTVGFVAVVLLLAAWRGRASWRVALAYVGLTGTVYVGYALWLVNTPGHLDILRDQLTAAGGASPWLQRVRLFVGTLFAANLEDGSALSLGLVVVAIILWGEWRGRVGRPAGLTTWSAPFTLAFVAVAVLPSLLLGYVGPRVVPLLLVTAWVIVRRAIGPAAHALCVVAPAAALINLAADLALRRFYVHETGPVWSHASWVWLGLAVGVWWAGRRGQLRMAAAITVSGVLIIGGTVQVRAMRPAGLVMSDAVVRSTAGALASTVPAEASVLCDPSAHYLALRLGHPDRRVYGWFPLFYFSGEDVFRRLMDGMHPDVILVTDTTRQQMVAVPAAGARLQRELETRFAMVATFDVQGMHTWVYRRTESPR